MTASLTVRQQASGQAKRENNEINRWDIRTTNDGVHENLLHLDLLFRSYA